MRRNRPDTAFYLHGIMLLHQQLQNSTHNALKQSCYQSNSSSRECCQSAVSQLKHCISGLAEALEFGKLCLHLKCQRLSLLKICKLLHLDRCDVLYCLLLLPLAAY